jgi:hypothetical protein
MADKFTRIGAAEGDVFYATNAGGAKSLEKLEDNIDAKMLSYVYHSTTAASMASTTTESELVYTSMSANTVNTGIFVIANCGAQTHTNPSNSEFKVRIGTSSVATSNTEVAFQQVYNDGNSTEMHATLMVFHTASTWTVGQRVSITGRPSENYADATATIRGWTIFGM